MLKRVLDTTKTDAEPRLVVVPGLGVVVVIVVLGLTVVVVVVVAVPPPIMLEIQLRWFVTRVKAPGAVVVQPGT